MNTIMMMILNIVLRMIVRIVPTWVREWLCEKCKFPLYFIFVFTLISFHLVCNCANWGCSECVIPHDVLVEIGKLNLLIC